MPTITKAIYNALEKTIQASLAKAATFNTPDELMPPTVKGVRIYLDVTAVSGTNPTMTVKVQVKDPVSGKYSDMPGAAFAEKTAADFSELLIYPTGVADVANAEINDNLTKTWRLVCTIGGTDTPTFTFTLGATYLY